MLGFLSFEYPEGVVLGVKFLFFYFSVFHLFFLSLFFHFCCDPRAFIFVLGYTLLLDLLQ